jgi:hypothetical protein
MVPDYRHVDGEVERAMKTDPSKLDDTFPYPAWLCQCGNGSLGAYKLPDRCPLCGFNLGGYFGEEG